MGQHRPGDGGEPDDLTVEQVRATLRDAADTYRPDRTAMINRVAVGRASTLPEGAARRTLRMNPIAAAFAVAAILVASISAARLSGGPDATVAAEPPPVSAPAVAGETSPVATAPAGTTPPGTAGTIGATGTARPTEAPGAPRSRQPSGPPRNGPSATATRETPAAPNGFLTSVGALDPNSGATWSQDNVRIISARPIVELTVTVTVALTPGLAFHGRYTDAPNGDMTLTVTPTPTSLVYSYVLNDGRKLAPGAYLFASQFRHHAGRDGTDSYTVVARAADGSAELSGEFR